MCRRAKELPKYERLQLHRANGFAIWGTRARRLKVSVQSQEVSKVSDQAPAAHAKNAPIAGEKADLARRYASALYELAEKEGVLDAVLADFQGLRRLWAESAEWRMIACDPRLKPDSILAATREVVKIAAPGKLVGHFLMIVAQNRRLSALPAMIETFIHDVAERRGEYSADVRAAHALTQAQAEKLTAALAALTGGKITLAVSEDAALLGGLTVQIGSKFIDASVKARLDRLERQLKSGVAA